MLLLQRVLAFQLLPVIVRGSWYTYVYTVHVCENNPDSIFEFEKHWACVAHLEMKTLSMFQEWTIYRDILFNCILEDVGSPGFFGALAELRAKRLLISASIVSPCRYCV